MVTLKRSIDEELVAGTRSPSEILIQAATIVDLGEDESTQASDTNYVSTMFRFSSASEAIVAVAGFIPEVNWTSNVRRVSLMEVCRCLSRSFRQEKPESIIFG